MRDKIGKYVSSWSSKGYEDGIPDEADAKLEALGLVPSYRKICKAILTNDLSLTTLGFSRPKCEAYSFLKKIEIEARQK